jgi:cob(I)alamin adenosyltransferase
MRGYIQVYTGDGKGKTTAALGLALRAAGAGLKVYIAQFIKKGDYNEIKALKKLSEYITIEQFGLGRFIKGKPANKDIIAAQNGLKKLKTIIPSEMYNVVILDEVNGAVNAGLLPISELTNLMDMKSNDLELVLTGRSAHPDILNRADLITEMINIKHYYKTGVKARSGIEK